MVAKIVDDADVLLEFYKYPAEHWIHLRTTNPIESTFATVRLRTKVTNDPGSRAAGIAMAYKLIDAAQSRWRAVNAPQMVALVRAGAVFHKGKLLERPIDITPAQTGESTETEVACNTSIHRYRQFFSVRLDCDMCLEPVLAAIHRFVSVAGLGRIDVVDPARLNVEASSVLREWPHTPQSATGSVIEDE